jgi:hypothetical protein
MPRGISGCPLVGGGRVCQNPGMGEQPFPKVIRSLLDKIGSKLGFGQQKPVPNLAERLRSYEPMPEAPLPTFDDGPAPMSLALADTSRLRNYYESLTALARMASLLNEDENVQIATLFMQIDALVERQVPELGDVAEPIMGILADSPEWGERRWAMHALVGIARLLPEMAGNFVPGFIAHIEAPSDVERDLEHLSRLPKTLHMAEQFGFAKSLTISFELPFPVGQYLQDVALEGLDQFAVIAPDFAQDAFSALEALSKEPTKAGERALALLKRLHLGERLRKVTVNAAFLADLSYPAVIAVSKSKKYHRGHCRFALSAIHKEAYLFVNAQEASEFGFGGCGACKDS